MAGEATEVGSIVGYLILNRSDWTAGVAATKRDSDELGRLSPNIRIQTNTGEVLGQLALVQAAERKVGSEAQAASKQVGGRGFGLVGALLSVAPAAVPLGAVAGGALAGLIPVVATVALGVQGITADLKDGSLAGTKYAADIGVLKSEATQLKQIAAGGLLAGLDKGLASSHGLFPEVNRDIGVMSGQIGEIVGSSGPALLALLHDMSPLFATFGSLVEDGAQHFEHWATSSDDVSQFVAYVQAELPEVVQFLGQLLTTVGHLAQASEGAGSGLLAAFTDVARAINSIPIGVLQVAIPLAVSLKAAMLGYAATTAVANAASTAWAGMGAVVTGVTASVIADEVASQAAVDEAEANKAAAALASARARQMLVAGISTSLAEEAAADVAAAESIAASEAAKAAETQAAAAAMAEANTAAGASMTAAAGPIGALLVGGALLATMFMHSGHSAQDSANQINNFTSALQQSKGAIDANVRATVAKSLADKGILEIARAQDISLQDVTSAALGQTGAWDRLQAAVNAQGKAYDDLYAKGQISHDQWYKMQVQLVDLVQGVGHTGDAFSNAAQKQRDEAAASAAATGAAKSQKAALDALNTALGTTVSNLLSAAQSEDQFLEAVRAVTKSVHDNGTSLSQNTAHGLANRDALLAAMQAALSYRDAQEKSGVSVRKANDTLAGNIQQLEQSAIHAGLSKTAVHDLVRQMDLVPHNIRTEFTANTANAKANIKFIKQQLAELPSYKTITVDVATRGNLQGTIHSQVPGRASGGGLPEGLAWVGERGPELVDKHGANAQVIPNGPAVAFAHAAGMSIPGFAGGTAGSADAAVSIVGLIKSGRFGQELLGAITQSVHAVTAAVHAVTAGLAGRAAASVQGQIAGSLAPAPSTVGGISALLSRDTGRADTAQQQALTSGANAKRLAEYAAAADKDAKADKARADAARNAADAMASSTKVERAAKKAAQEHADQLETTAKRTKALADAADSMASRGKSAWQKYQQAASTAIQTAQQDAQSLVQAFTDAESSFMSTVTAFGSNVTGALTSGASVSGIWGQLLGVTDANGDPVPPDLGALQTGEETVLAQLKQFSADLNSLTGEGANQDLINELLGVQSQSGTGAADQLAQQLLAGGTGAVSALQSVMGQITAAAGSETDTLTQTFYGAGAQSIDNIGKGILAEFPSMRKAIAPILAELAKDFTLTPTITAPNTSALMASLGGKGKKGSNGSQTVMVPYTVPGFASGVTDFAGGLALVHRDELLVNLPRGTDVIPANRAKAGAFAGGPAVATLAPQDRALLTRVAVAMESRPVVLMTSRAGEQVIGEIANDHRQERILHGDARYR